MPEKVRWLRPGEAAAILGVDEMTIRRYFDAGKLDDPEPSIRLPGGHRRIHPASLVRLYRETYGPDAPEPALPE